MATSGVLSLYYPHIPLRVIDRAGPSVDVDTEAKHNCLEDGHYSGPVQAFLGVSVPSKGL